jgi:uncharacterized protein
VKIDLSAIDQEDLELDEPFELEPDRLDPDQVASALCGSIHGRIRPVHGSYQLEARIEASGSLLCSRCLAPVPWQLDETFAVELRPIESASAVDQLDLDEDQPEVSFVTDNLVDLEEVAAEQLLLAFPMRIVCREDCKGLCPRCGGNRNVPGECVCTPEVDPRWAPLGKLLS